MIVPLLPLRVADGTGKAPPGQLQPRSVSPAGLLTTTSPPIRRTPLLRDKGHFRGPVFANRAGGALVRRRPRPTAWCGPVHALSPRKSFKGPPPLSCPASRGEPTFIPDPRPSLPLFGASRWTLPTKYDVPAASRGEYPASDRRCSAVEMPLDKSSIAGEADPRLPSRYIGRVGNPQACSARCGRHFVERGGHAAYPGRGPATRYRVRPQSAGWPSPLAMW